MSDLFHKDVPDDYIRDVCRVMSDAHWHKFQVLTKRSERMRDLLNTKLDLFAPLKYIWWGVSVENQKHGLPRIQHLQEARCNLKFLSIEPLLEDLGEFDMTGIDWVIVGGESGPGARPMEQAWVESIQKQCEATKIPFFFKQWGGVHKKENGRLLNGKEYNEFPKIALPMV
jgi:protein gp37